MAIDPQHPGLSRLNHVGIVYVGAVAELGRGCPLSFIPDNAPGLRPVRDLVQMVLILRAENNALLKVLYDKGLLDEKDMATFTQQVNDEADWLADRKAEQMSDVLGVRLKVKDYGMEFEVVPCHTRGCKKAAVPSTGYCATCQAGG